MTSLTALTPAAAPAAPAFNSNFYITAATAIPTLFVALAVQGNGYENLLKASARLSQRGEGNRHGWAIAIAGSSALIGIAIAILFFAILGEILAVYALYQQQAESGTEVYVLVGTVAFVLATAAGPAITFARFYYRAFIRRPMPASAKDNPIND